MSEQPAWLQDDFNALQQQYNRSELPHGLLLVGQAGNGAGLLLAELSQLLLCLQPTSQSCGVCKSCQLMQSGHHPDFIKIEPEGKSQTIKVDSIRTITKKISETAQQGGNKVVHIESAQKMNINAANALLKVLEEPTDNTFLLLESTELSQTLPTIRSRCRIIRLAKPNIEQSLQYLNAHQVSVDARTALTLTNNQPLDALKLSEESISEWFAREVPFLNNQTFTALSSFIAKQEMTELLEQILIWIDSTIRYKQNSKLELAPISEPLLKSLAEHENVSLFNFRDYIVGKLSALRRQANLNSQLMAEELASRWSVLRGIG